VRSGPAPDRATRRRRKEKYRDRKAWAREYYQRNKARIRERVRRDKELHKALGLCVNCKQPIDPRSTSRCARHLELNRKHVKQSHLRKAA